MTWWLRSAPSTCTGGRASAAARSAGAPVATHGFISASMMLARFPAEDQADMVENGEIAVTCEFCSTTYHVAPGDISR